MSNKTINPTETVKAMFAAFGAGNMDELKKPCQKTPYGFITVRKKFLTAALIPEKMK